MPTLLSDVKGYKLLGGYFIGGVTDLMCAETFNDRNLGDPRYILRSQIKE